MKNFLLGLFLVTTVAFAALYFNQNGQLDKARKDLARTKGNLTELEGKLSQQEQRSTGIREQWLDTRKEANANASQVQQLQQVLAGKTDVSGGTNNFRDAMSSMLKSPEMRAMVKKQQEAVVGMMIDRNYADFFKSLNLSPEQSAALKDFISKKALIDAGMGLDLMAGNMDADQRKAITDQAKSERDAIDEQIKGFLGTDNYAQYQAYEKTIPERQALQQFKDSLAGSSTMMSGDQEQQLLKAMSDEREAFKFSTDFQDRSKFDGDFENTLTDEKIDTFLAEQEQLTQKYLERARAILSADQLASYEKFLANQREMTKAGLKMAAAMFGGKSSK